MMGGMGENKGLEAWEWTWEGGDMFGRRKGSKKVCGRETERQEDGDGICPKG